MIETATRFLKGNPATGTYRECRRCGTSLPTTVEQCDTCGSGDVAVYVFD